MKPNELIAVSGALIINLFGHNRSITVMLDSNPWGLIMKVYPNRGYKSMAGKGEATSVMLLEAISLLKAADNVKAVHIKMALAVIDKRIEEHDET